MKAMLLAAGRGARMRPLTDTAPKPLIQVNGKALLDFHLTKLSAAGFTDVVINTSWLAELIQKHVQQSNYPTLNITLSHEPVALETAGGIHKALPLLGDDPFLLISADIWSEIDYSQLRETQLGDADAHLLMVANPPHNTKGDFSITNNRIVPAAAETFTYSGIGVYTTQPFRDIAAQGTEVQAPIRDILLSAIDRGAITGQVSSTAWFDIGTVERLKALELYISEDSSDK